MNGQRVALVTGITGQDGSYLTELLLSKGYEVHGIIRRSSLFNTDRIDHLYVDPHKQSNFHLHYGDLSDAGALRNVLDDVQPDEVYNLGAQSHVRVSFDQPEYTVDVVGVGVIRLLEAIRSYMKHSGKKIRFYQAGSSEMFGSAKPRQHEGTRFEPRSPYACAKVYAHYQVINHRESYGDFLGLTFGRLDLDWQKHVEIDPRYFRPAEVDYLEGDASKGRRILGWEPKTDIRALANMMVDSDLKLAQKELLLCEAGHGATPRAGYR